MNGKRTGGHGARNVLDVVVSWPGITPPEVAEELGLAMATTRTYIVCARRAGWLHSGAVPRLIDCGDRWEPDYMAADLWLGRDCAIYRKICRLHAAQLPARREDINAGEGWDRMHVIRAVYRLRQAGLLQPRAKLFATDSGERIAHNIHDEPAAAR